ncbi:protein of unknown function [Tessaracoccus bendigoensis DSM 12906]|uniref:DUF4194 domain-containing protein n=1 Tax=Tessaracoccus bendigoensis DSM 12906 TaxID=1123357 RepID=A0A1M6J8F8_9ACTN|nr:DUF4194 domain-containing protein [Tessaracoccus bendigoensis]SHJ42978.1 protein of unknown function [Tessaracoccus bendigoensis DSM 12906]
MTDDVTGFIAPVAMENDLGQLFPGDRGVLDHDVRRVLVRLLQRRFLLKERSGDDWRVLLDNQQVIESRLGDLFVRLEVDHERGVAYKSQVRSDELEVPILLRDDAYTRAETLVLVHLRTLFQRESSTGEQSARVDVEEIEQTVLTYFAESDGDTARRQKAIRGALARLRNEGIVEEESEGRYRISPIIEIVLSSERLRELAAWLRDNAGGRVGDAEDDPDGDELGEVDESEFDSGPPTTQGPPDDDAVQERDEGPDPETQPMLGDVEGATP